MNDTIQQITIGDWSDDGHNQKEHFTFVSNKTTEELQQGYLNSCKLTEYTFDTNATIDNVTPKARLLNKFEDSYLSPEVIEDLMEFGLPDPRTDDTLFAEEFDEIVGQYVTPEDCFRFVMWFISISLPDLEYEIRKADVEQVNGYWGNLNQQFGYGCFSW